MNKIETFDSAREVTQNQKVLGKLMRFVSERRRFEYNEKGNYVDIAAPGSEDIERTRFIKKQRS